MNIEKAIPMWVVGAIMLVGGPLAGYVTAQDADIRKEIRDNAKKNHEQDLAVRELQIRMDQLLVEQRATNMKLDTISTDVKRMSNAIVERLFDGEHR